MRGFLFKAGFISLLGLLFLSCGNKNPVNSPPDCGGIDPLIVPAAPYLSAIWHPGGLLIGFNHSPLDTIMYPFGEGCWGEKIFSDKYGFWLINADGTNMHKIFKYRLGNPAWSPDGQWIAFDLGAPIFKMRFSGDGFDTTTVVQLTFEGSNAHPAWSPDGQWIAYSNSIGDTVGIWISPADGSGSKKYFTLGGEPDWKPNDNKILYASKGGLWIESLDHSFKTKIYSMDPRKFQRVGVPKYSPDGSRIAFWAQPDKGYSNIWVMDANGANPQQITFTGVKDWLDWSPDGSEIIYTDYRFDDWTYDNGTLWMVNPDTGERKQLTRNTKPAQ